MAALKNIVKFLEDNLDMTIQDFGINGLQVDGPQEVDKIVVGVDACLELFEEAKKRQAGLVVTHHGIFWGGDPQPITGLLYQRIGLLIRNNTALFAVHLPLDRHPSWGHNALILQALGVEPEADPDGEVDWLCPHGALPQELSREQLLELLNRKLDAEATVWPFGPELIGNVMVTSGSGLSMLEQAIELGCHAFITGEPRHSNYYEAKEAGINVFFAGHFATETPGMKALAAALEREFHIPAEFVSLPTGH